MCHYKVDTTFFRLNLGVELDLEEWRRKLDIFNRGYRRIYLPGAEVVFGESSVEIYINRARSYWYTINRNGDIKFSFGPDGPYWERDEEQKKFNLYLKVLAEFLRNNKIDIPLDKAKVQEEGISGSFVKCRVDLERAEMLLENEMDVEYNVKTEVLLFKLEIPKALVTLNEFGFGSVADSLGSAYVAVDEVMKKIRKVKACEYIF